MENLLQKFKNSIYGPQFYTVLNDKPLGFSLGYYAGFFGLLILVGTIVASFLVIPKLIVFVDRAGEEISMLYPEELVVTINDGEVSTNMEEPVLIPFTSAFEEVLRDREAGERSMNFGTTTPYLIAIDTRENGVTEGEYVALVTITKNTIIYPSQSGGFTIDPIPPDAHGVITKPLVDHALAALGRWANFIPVGFVLVALLAGIVYAVFHLLYLLLASLLLMLVLAAKGLPVEYARAYQIGLHALTGPILVKLALFPLLPNIPFLFTLLLLAFAWVNISAPQRAVE